MNTMCEWLTCGDWCDVRLMCGGRFFNAHRAVLASVSTFLRKMLLSCPLDESPLFIFLPEFDLDALSSILYYIYNGEVLIPNHKVKMFLDIANAMEIFIDQKYILQIDDNIQYGFGHTGDDKLLAKDNYNICQLKLCNGKSGCFINDRKSTRNEKLNHQEPIVSLKACDKAIQTFRWSEEQIPDLGNLTSVSRYRQRQSFLRDIFIETFSQDSNVNGQKPGVLAISNEEYRIPSTALFSNAIEHYPGESKTLADMPKKLLEQNNPASFDYLRQFNGKDYKIRNKSNINLSYTVYNQMVNNFNAECVVENGLKKKHDIDLWKKCTPLEISLPLLSRNSSNFPIETQNSFLNLEDTSGVKSSEIPKATIMNEVLQNPWLPIQPQSYRPFPKKDLNSTNIEKNYENKASVTNKDNNNNSDTAMKTKYEKEIDEPVSSEQQDLRCIVCQEAFTRKQDYTIHMRRHSSMNRYSCGECYKTFSQLRNFKYHMSVHRGTKEFAATCSVCGKHFNDRGYLSNHMKIHRNRKEYKCASCPKSFNQRVAFNMHIRIHTGVKPHICEECGKAFSRKMLLKQHQRTHSGERPYACAHCGKRFADRSNMTLHLRLHTGEKPFSCTLCPKSFTKKHHLKSHLNFHTGAKPYSCPRCNLAFTQSSNMRTHYKKCNVTS